MYEKTSEFAFKNLDEFNPHAKRQIEYAIKQMPINMFKSIANSESINSIKEFNKVSSSAETKREEWERELGEHEQRVETLKSSLSTYESGFNFVGLFEGFNNLSKAKNTEKCLHLIWLIVVGALVTLPLFAEIGVLYLNLDKLDKIKAVLALSIVPTVSLVAILIYYFRVILHNYKSIKSQLLQIELRKTLCRFIDHYSEYSSKMKKQDKTSLEKFENIIFSGIVSDDGNLPSTYDGIEQLGKLIKSVK